MAGVLLVHGAFHGPWCWSDFAQRLAQRGHDVRTVQLRGHDHAPGRIWHRLRHYLEDVRSAAEQFAEPPVLVGHSMGGLLVQIFLESHPAAGGVLMASVPPGGTLPAVMRLFVRHPIRLLKANLLWTLRPLVTSEEMVRELFFSPSTPREAVDQTLPRLQDESYPAFIDLLFSLRRRRRPGAPVLVLGAERDGVLTVDEIHRTARAHQTEAEIFPGMGHDMMLDDGWQDVADRVGDWVREVVTRPAAPHQSAPPRSGAAL